MKVLRSGAPAEILGFSINATTQQSNSGGVTGAGLGVEGYRVDVPELANVEMLWRLWEALQIEEKLGVSTDKIVTWRQLLPLTFLSPKT